MINRELGPDSPEQIRDFSANIAGRAYESFDPESTPGYRLVITAALGAIDGVMPDIEKVEELANDARSAFESARSGGGIAPNTEPILRGAWEHLPEDVQTKISAAAESDPAKALLRTIIFGSEPGMIKKIKKSKS